MEKNTNKPDFFALYAAILVVLVGLMVGVVSAVVSPVPAVDAASCRPVEAIEETPLGQVGDVPAPTEKRIKLDGACPEAEPVALKPRQLASD